MRRINNYYYYKRIKVNLDPQTRSTILNKISSNHPDGEIFDQAQKRIQHIMEQDPYARFLKSELFLEIIHPEFYEKDLQNSQ